MKHSLHISEMLIPLIKLLSKEQLLEDLVVTCQMNVFAVPTLSSTSNVMQYNNLKLKTINDSFFIVY